MGREREGEGEGEGEGHGVISGADAFMLYDTYGFPLEITEEVAAEAGITVDVGGFEAALEDARTLSRSAHDAVDMTANAFEGTLAQGLPPTAFVGYESDISKLSVRTTLHAILSKDTNEQVKEAKAGDDVRLVLASTPFYAEAGGQVGDRGVIVTAPGAPGVEGKGAAEEAGEGARVVVGDTQKLAGGTIVVHDGRVEYGTLSLAAGSCEVVATVDAGLRKGACIHHTATHLLQTALKQTLGPDVCQAGSLVKADSLRFDFNHPEPMTPGEISAVEGLVNGWVGAGHALGVASMPIAEAKQAGATAMFGEKYGEVVRVVDVVGMESMELCGGTHVGSTEEIRAFKIVSEGGVASGIRRIEAIAGDAAVAHMSDADDVVKQLSQSLKVNRSEVFERTQTMAKELRAAQKTIAQLNAQLATAKTATLVSSAKEAGGHRVLVAEVDGMDAKALAGAAQDLASALGDASAVVLGTRLSKDKVSLAVALGSETVAQEVHAGKFVSAVAEICGGKGGGRPNFAQAGGTEPSKLQEAIAVAERRLHEQLAGH